MYTKKEVIEMIARQYDQKQSVIDYIINKMVCMSDELIEDQFTKSCGSKLQKIGSQFVIKF
jgi:hypothetical protein